MHAFRDSLNELDLSHLRQILGERQDPTFSQTKRRSRVNQIAIHDTFLADQALEAFKALTQGDRERLISDVVWRLTCHVEGSITKSPGKGMKLEFGFRLTKVVQDGRPVFCVGKPE